MRTTKKRDMMTKFRAVYRVAPCQEAYAICLRDRDKNSLRAPGATMPFSRVLGMPRTLAYPDFPHMADAIHAYVGAAGVYDRGDATSREESAAPPGVPRPHVHSLSMMYNGLELTCEPDILGIVEKLTSLASGMTNTHPPAGG